MSDMIDRRQAIKAIEDLQDCPNGFSDTYDKACIIGVLEEIPAVDAVPVIRCRDCVHYKGHWYCDAWNNSPGFPAVTEDGFCNMAERRTDADN